jgi:hypothetical protein
MNITLEQWADIASIGAAIIAIGALVYTASQVHASTKVNRAQFWLEIRKMFAEHWDIHLKLRNREWSLTPPSDEELAKLEAYMGLFEHCEKMLKEGLLDWETFKAIYGYRVHNLLCDLIVVREKLIARRSGWLVFIKLLGRMCNEIPQRRYLSGYWDINTNKWKLWWGFVDLEEGSSSYDTFEDLERSFADKFEELTIKESGLTHAWLMSKTDVVSQWPSPHEQPSNSDAKQQDNVALGGAIAQQPISTRASITLLTRRPHTETRRYRIRFYPHTKAR